MTGPATVDEDRATTDNVIDGNSDDLGDELDRVMAAQARAREASLLSAAQKKKLAAKQRPAWAYTEGAQEKELEEMEEAELEDLLRFTEELDFDKYVEDMEVKTALENLKERIDFLAPEEGEDIGDALERAIERKRKERRAAAGSAGNNQGRAKLTESALEEWNARNSGPGNLPTAAGLAEGEEADDVSVIQSLMSDVKSIRSIHSARSINALRKRIKRLKQKELQDKKKKSGLDLGTIPETGESMPEYKEPRIAMSSEQSRLEGKFQASRLPYINRNPAV
jgi:hypothetical protein